MTDDEVCILVDGVWFEGIVMQVDDDVVLLHNEKSPHTKAYYTTAIDIKSIKSLQFTTDFRPNKGGALLIKEEIEEQ